DRLGSDGLRLADLTGDGTLDVFAGAPAADVAGVPDAGACFLWNGGPALVGTKTPDATLTVPGAAPSAGLGTGGATGIRLEDGTSDVVGGWPTFDTTAGVDVGSWFVWRGGAGLVGTKTPDATLAVSTAVAGDGLGSGGVRVADLTGDGLLDVVASTPNSGGTD